ncbi:MAG: SPASM domain-containing protein, partial [Bacteroidales bacterium]|nr:SPASM domain-containing protein [Bacteroidales bacterium]
LSIDEVKKLITDKAANNEISLKQIKEDAKKKKDITSDDFVCSICNSSICITENGYVYPCAGWQDYVVGNVKETSLYDIWNNSAKVKYLRELRRYDFLKCIKCTDKEFCTMCMVRNANESRLGNPLEVNEYFCNIAKFNKKLVIG